VGHYEIDCGGCDTISGNEAVYNLQSSLALDSIVIAEGIMLSEDVKWSTRLEGLRVLFLTTSLDVCLERVRSRRMQSGNKKVFDPARTIRRYNDFLRIRQRLVDAGVDCRRCLADQAPGMILKWLRPT
jgi:hypothetical protein